VQSSGAELMSLFCSLAMANGDGGFGSPLGDSSHPRFAAVDPLSIAAVTLARRQCRPRRAFLHLSYSCAPPFGPATLVTQDPNRSSER
jgi:hypothetical protein